MWGWDEPVAPAVINLWRSAVTHQGHVSRRDLISVRRLKTKCSDGRRTAFDVRSRTKQYVVSVCRDALREKLLFFMTRLNLRL